MSGNNTIIEAVFKIHNKLNELSATPRDFGTGEKLYSSEIHTIIVIGEKPGINLTGLSLTLGVSKSAGSKFIKKLLAKGYVIKGRAVSNRREVIFNLTEKGQLALQGHNAFSRQRFQKLYKVLQKYEAEFSGIRNFLEDFCSGLDS